MTTPLTRKVLLIGWDAADWKIITPLLDAGDMPNLATLLARGVMGNLATLYPVLSPMLWTSIATGKRAHKHGIHGFTEPDSAGGVRPITQLGRKTKAVWNILNQAGLKSNVIGWWPSHPAEPLNGVMVSDFYQKHRGGLDQPWPLPPGTVHPERLRQPLAQLRIHPHELDGEQLLPFVPNAARIDQRKDKRLLSIAKVVAECSSVHAAATAVMQREPWDFMAVYFDAIDHFCHGFMRYHPPRLDWVPEADFELYKDVVNTGYRFHDLMLGTLMTLAGDDTTIILCSDHGFHPDHLRPKELPNEPAGPAEEHRRFGVIALSGPGIKQDDLVFGANLLDITPTILSLFGLPIGRDMDGKPLINAFDRPVSVDYLDSWDSQPGDDGRLPPNLRIDPVDAQEALNQLVELGYVDSPNADQQTAVANTVRELRYNLARDYADAKRLPEALAILDALWRDWPDEHRFGLHSFHAHLALGQLIDARATLHQLTQNKRTQVGKAQEELRALQESWQDKKPEDLSEADQRRLRKLHRQAGTNTATFAYLNGLLLSAEGRYEAAIGEFEQARNVQLHNRPDLYDKIGQALLALRRWQPAEAEFRRMLEIDPINPAAELGLCRSLLPQRRYEEALNHAMHAIGLVYHQPQAHFYGGLALWRLRRWPEAERSLLTALEQNPVFPAAHKRLARLYRGPLAKPVKAAEHAALALAAQRRIADFQAGQPLPNRQQADLDPQALATLGDLGQRDAGPLTAETVVIVSGLPRSGTSMMMQMLAAGGLPVLTDEVRAADASNPRGYYEYEPAKRLGQDNQWLTAAGGKVVKLVAQLLPRLPSGRPYRIVFMERPLGEVVASQQTLLQRLGRTGAALSPARLAQTFSQQINAVRQVLLQYPDSVQVLAVNYHDVLADPAGTAARVSAFLGGGLDTAAMAAAVEPALHNQRRA